MKQGICYVVGAGGFWGLDRQPAEADFVIAADAGHQQGPLSDGYGALFSDKFIACTKRKGVGERRIFQWVS